MKSAFAAGFLAVLPAFAQPAPATFEAADVHASPASANAFFDSGFLPGGRYQLRYATMVNLIAEAYEIDAESVSGGPPWLDTDRFDVIAKAPTRATESERAAMLRALLADRFKLKVHDDQNPLKVYVLAVSKRGAQLQESGTAGTLDCKAGQFEEGPPAMISVACPSITMPQFARELHQMAGGYLQNEVADFTGLKGAYAITVKWSPAGVPKTNDKGEPSGKVSIFDAVEKELGLTLDLTTRPFPSLPSTASSALPPPTIPRRSKNFRPS